MLEKERQSPLPKRYFVNGRHIRATPRQDRHHRKNCNDQVNYLMRLRALCRLGFLAAIILVSALGCGVPLLVGCGGHRSEEKFSQPTEEQTFCYESGLAHLLDEGRITYGQFKEIYNAHKRWLREREEKKELDYERNTSYIGRDSNRIHKIIKDHKKNSYESHFWRPDYKLVYCCRYLGGPDLRNLDLRWAYLPGAKFSGANLIGSGTRADAATSRPDIDLGKANLTGAEITQAKGRESLLRFALLIGTDFNLTDLSGAVLRGADARWAKFEGTNLTDADFSLAKVSGAVYEPKSDGLPKVSQMASADGLHKLTYRESPTGLIELRNAFDASGFGKQARQVTHAIWWTERVKGWKGNIFEQVEAMISFVLFEVTSAYGMEPYRPLLILLLLIPLFSVPYTFVIFGKRRSGIWANRPSAGVNKKVLEKWVRIESRKQPNRVRENLRVIRIAVWFSVLNAFRIGFREFSIGDWILRLQSRQYELRATGWARSVAGCQALISLYLVALSALSFLGRPFG